MNANLMYAEEAPFDILEIRTPFSQNQNHQYAAKISTKTRYDPHNSDGVNGRQCNGNQNQYSGVKSSKRRFTICPSSQATGGTASKITEHSGCTSPPPIPNHYSGATRTVTSLYDFATPNQAFQALFGNEKHAYYCPLLDDENDHELLMTLYKQIVTEIRKQVQ